MNVLYLLLAFGAGVGLLAVAIAIGLDRLAKRRRLNAGARHIPGEENVGLRINPGAMMGQIGVQDQPHMTFNKVFMRPTLGMRIFALFIMGALALVLSGEQGAAYRQDLMTWALVIFMVSYLLLFLGFYEVSYDNEGLTAPSGLFFQPKTLAWEDFIAIDKVDDVTYRLVFETGTLKVRKFLVGMPTFLTFVTEVREMNKRR